MVVKSRLPELTLERVRTLLSEWFATRNTTTVEFKENLNPENDFHDDYMIGYEANFIPKSLDQAYVHIGVTPDGYVAIGYEKSQRISERLRLKSKSACFASGHEPHSINEPGLIGILNSIADGEVAVPLKVLPIINPYPTDAIVTHDVLRKLILKDDFAFSWLKGVSQAEFERKNLIHYNPWK